MKRPASDEVVIEWWQNPGSVVTHAYVRGPGSGDAALCGRATLDSDAERHANKVRCHYCRFFEVAA